MHLAQLFRDKAKNILYNTFVRGISAAGSASPWHGGGHGFESRMLHSRKSREIRRIGFFPCFFILDREENTALADEKCALAVHDATRNAARTTQNQRSLPRISPIDISDAPYLDIFRPGVFLKRRFRLTEQLIERNLFLKAIDHRQNISRILREHGAGGIRHGRAENPLVIG